jgi:regulator of sigma E protease
MITTLLAVVFVFGLLIIGHEFGHFITAKLSNIKVLEFSVGMGPRPLRFGKGETQYSWRVFPIGGYVKMLGEEEQVDDPRSFSCKPTLVRMAVIAAGPIMNIVISIIIFAIIAMAEGYTVPVVREYVKPPTGFPEFQYPAQKGGILPGDRIVAANGEEILTYKDFTLFMYQNGGKPVTLVIERDGKEIPLKSITPIMDPVEKRYLIGIVPKVENVTIFQGIRYGYLDFATFTKQILGFFKDLIVGKASTADVSGPVGIVRYAGDAARNGFGSLVSFTAILSINLAILNLVPFPALDGGWLLILLIESIRRKKLDANKVGIINFIGFAFLMIITILVTFKDIFK